MEVGDAYADVLVGRQPIFDAAREVVGYELLFRSDGAEDAARPDERRATATVVAGSLTEIGLDRLVGARRAWINVGRNFLLDGLAGALPPERTVLEILEDQLVDDELVAVVGDLRRRGYRIALDDFVYRPEVEPLLGLADIVKLDVIALGPDGVAEHARRLAPRGVMLLAEKVETPEERTFCREAGCELFQGYFFCRPETIRSRRAHPGGVALLQFVAALHDPAVEFAEIERLLTRDVGLSYRLLCYVNSAFFGLRQQVRSISQALVLIGLENLRRWAMLSLFAGIAAKPQELTVTALLRARFCELAGARLPGADASELFTLGLFSVIDALLDLPLGEILDGVPFTESLRVALLERSGALGSLLQCLAHLEAGQSAAAEALVPGAAGTYLAAIAWATEAAAALDATP
jgi:EAL and modified HD-GYP domain-containing signal transduction protein